MTMKRAMSWPAIIVLVSIFLLIGFTECDVSPDCDCSYHEGGCVINSASPQGFKCKCHYTGGWTCQGTAFPCVGQESCPGSRADHCACELGGGNCGGYKIYDKICPPAIPIPGVPGSADCDCSYHSGGCIISTATPKGWKCVCVYKGFWTCDGWAQQCSEREFCPADDYSYCACEKGGGNCGAYPNKPSCPDPYIFKECDCNESEIWTKGFYTIANVTYSTNNSKIKSLDPVVLAEKDIRNNSTEKQTISFEVQELLTETSTFSHTLGITIEAGVGFDAGIPFIAEGKVSIKISVAKSFTWGKTTTITKSFKETFTCNGAPHKHTKCSIIVQKGKLDAPYNMTVKHSLIKDCTCPSYGVWSGVELYDSKLVSSVVGNCSTSNCESEWDHQVGQEVNCWINTRDGNIVPCSNPTQQPVHHRTFIAADTSPGPDHRNRFSASRFIRR